MNTRFKLELLGSFGSLSADPLVVKTLTEGIKAPIIHLSGEGLEPIPLDLPRFVDVKGFVNCRAPIPTNGQEVTVAIENREARGEVYYSLDGGENWNRYEKEFKTNYIQEENIQAKVVVGHNVSKTIKQKNDYVLDLSKNCTRKDALDKAAFDGDPSTVVTKNGLFYIDRNVHLYNMGFILGNASDERVYDNYSDGRTSTVKKDSCTQFAGAWYLTRWGKKYMCGEQYCGIFAGNVCEVVYNETIPNNLWKEE